MKNQALKIVFLLIALCFAIVSCTKEVDFNQINDLELNPVIESSIFHFEASAQDFVLGGTGAVSFNSDFVEIDVFNNQFVNDNLIKAELEFEIINSINRRYQMTIEFWNDFSSSPLYSFPISVDASPLNENLTFNYIEEFEENKLLDLKASTRMRFVLTMLSGTSIDPNTPGSISLKSKGVFYLKIEA